jgi:hypothetical protein
VAHAGHPVAQHRRGPDGGGGRVVELVREPGGQRAECQQPLPLADDRLDAAHRDEEPLEQMHRHREPAAHRGGEQVGGQHEELDVGEGPQRVAVHLGHLVADVGLGSPGVHPALVGAADLHLVAVHLPGHRHRAGQQHVEARRVVALGVDLAGRLGLDPAVLGQPVQLLVVERLEEEQRLQVARGQPLGHCASR